MLPAAAILHCTAYRLPKQGNTEAECEDAYAADPQIGRFAIADGASESAFARPWAEALAAGFVAHPGPWSGWLPAARAAWHKRFESDSMSWYAEAKFQDGAFATLLGLALCRSPRRDGRLRWRALAVGDCCLFQLRGDRLRRAFPVTRSTDFDNRPALLGSRSALPHSPPCKRCRARGVWRPGDVFLLMTDALAQWFLREVEDGERPWILLASAQDEAAFSALVEQLRASRRLRNDDTSLLWIASEPAPTEPVKFGDSQAPLAP
jgi:hypothetical protein